VFAVNPFTLPPVNLPEVKSGKDIKRKNAEVSICYIQRFSGERGIRLFSFPKFFTIDFQRFAPVKGCYFEIIINSC
jgi:hypothetical protein